MPASSALWITLVELSRSSRCPKLLQPSPTSETRRPELPTLRNVMVTSYLQRGRRRSHARAAETIGPAMRLQPARHAVSHLAFASARGRRRVAETTTEQAARSDL